MSDGYTPDEDTIRAVWRGHWDPESIVGKNADAEFSRWLEQHDMETREETRQEAYADGYLRGFEDGQQGLGCQCGYGGYHEEYNADCPLNRR